METSANFDILIQDNSMMKEDIECKLNEIMDQKYTVE